MCIYIIYLMIYIYIYIVDLFSGQILEFWTLPFRIPHSNSSSICRAAARYPRKPACVSSANASKEKCFF